MADKAFYEGDKVTLQFNGNGWHIEMNAADGKGYHAPAFAGTYESPEAALAALRESAITIDR